MRLKYYLRGLGLGIIFTVIIMTIGNHSSKQTAGSDASEYQNSTQPATESLFKADTETESVSEQESESEKTVPDSSKPDNDISTDDITKDISTSDISDNTPADNTADNASDNNTQPQVNTTFTLTVSPSDTCRMISEKLQAAGVIDDAENFRVYMGQKGADHLIANGDHEIPYGASYDDIINILTQK